MANYYSEYSAILPLSEEMRPAVEYLMEHMEDLTEKFWGADERTYEQILVHEGCDEVLAKQVLGWFKDAPQYDGNPFGDNFVIEEDWEDNRGKGFNIWMSGEYGLLLEDVLCEMLKDSGRGDIVVVEIGFACDKPRIDAFGGSVCVIGPGWYEWDSTSEMAKRIIEKHKGDDSGL